MPAGQKSDAEMSMDRIHPWIGLDWIGSNSGECCVNRIRLGPMTVMYKIMAAYVFQRNIAFLIFSHKR